MDLPLFGRVLWRWRLLVLAGVILAIALAVLSIAKVGFDGGMPTLTYRSSETWQARSTLLLTQQGLFPEGRSIFPPAPVAQDGETPPPYPYAGTGRFAELAPIYAQLAASDAVIGILRRSGPIRGSVDAIALQSPSNTPSPMISLFATGATPGDASDLVQRARIAFITFLSDRQTAAKIPPGQRVDVRVVRELMPPILLEPRKKTLPIVVLLAVVSATVGLAFVLENMRGRSATVLPVRDEESEERQRVSLRRGA